MPDREWSLRLSPRERWKFFQVMLILPVISVGLRFLGWRRCQALLARSASLVDPARALRPPGEAQWQARRMALVARRAVRRNPFPSTCLQRSLVLWWLLRQEGLNGDLRIGVRKPRGKFEAHAWVEYQGKPLNDKPRVREEFAAFPQEITATMFTKD